MSDELVREQRGPVLIARLNRPEARNALNGALIGAISEAILDADADPDVLAVVLTGTGDRAFSPAWTCGTSPPAPRRSTASQAPWKGSAGWSTVRSWCRSSGRPTPPRWREDSSCCWPAM